MNDAGSSLCIHFAHIIDSETSLWIHSNIIFLFHNHIYHTQNTIERQARYAKKTENGRHPKMYTWLSLTVKTTPNWSADTNKRITE